jgi:hypothetical protein
MRTLPPPGRAERPEEVAAAAGYLLSQNASFDQPATLPAAAGGLRS